MVGVSQWPGSAENSTVCVNTDSGSICNKGCQPPDPASEPGRKWNRIDTRHARVGWTPLSYLDSFRRPINLPDVIVLSSVPPNIADCQNQHPPTFFRIPHVTVLHGVLSAVHLACATENTISFNQGRNKTPQWNRKFLYHFLQINTIRLHPQPVESNSTLFSNINIDIFLKSITRSCK
jgi:hypothetical protein